MITLLADSNALRHPGLKAYLQASRDHAIPLSDLTLVEMRKTRALSTSRESLQIVAHHAQQSYALRRTHEVLGENISSEKQTHVLFDYEATAYLTGLARRLLTLPPPRGLIEEMAQHEADAQLIIARLTEEVSALEPGLVSAAKDFTQAELTQIRTMTDVTDSTRRKLLDLLKETTGTFILWACSPSAIPSACFSTTWSGSASDDRRARSCRSASTMSSTCSSPPWARTSTAS